MGDDDKILAFKRPFDVGTDYPKWRTRHTRLYAAMKTVMLAGDLTEEAVAIAVGRSRSWPFSIVDSTPDLLEKSVKIAALARARWEGFPMPDALVAALDTMHLDGLAVMLDYATDEVCLLVHITKSDIEAGLKGVQLVSSVVMGTPYEIVFRTSLFVAIEVFQRKPWPRGTEAAIDAMDEARGQLLDALTGKRKVGDDDAD